MYESKTRDVVVRVEPEFLTEQSSPQDNRFIWAYTVEIENQSSEDLQVVNRFWKIADRNGHVQEVSGEGRCGGNTDFKTWRDLSLYIWRPFVCALWCYDGQLRYENCEW